jgi:prepilin-type N-terminal cleavage/methylation domain-containing protein
MRKSSFLRSSARSGFTLVELLVVISIIALLAGLAFTGGTAARTAARKAQTANLLNTIKIGIASYQTEYGRLPNPEDAPEDTQYASTDEAFQNIVEALMGTSEDSSEGAKRMNPRGIAFCDIQNRDFKNGSPRPGEAASFTLADPWKHPIYILLDYSYDNKIEAVSIQNMPEIAKPTDALRGSVALWSQGPARGEDGDTSKMTAGDLVATWK